MSTKHSSLPYKMPWNVKYSVPSNPYVKHHIRSGNRVVALVNPTHADIEDTTDETCKEGRIHAAHIVKCVNLHDDLMAALEEMQRAAHHCAMQLGVDFSTHWKSANDHCNTVLTRARQ